SIDVLPGMNAGDSARAASCGPSAASRFTGSRPPLGGGSYGPSAGVWPLRPSGGEDALGGLRMRAGGVQRRGQPRPPAGALPAEGRHLPAGQLAERGVLPAAAHRVPRAGPPLLSGEQVVVG